MDNLTDSRSTVDHCEDAAVASEMPTRSLSRRLLDTLPTFALTNVGSVKLVTATAHYESESIPVFAQTRADQLVELIDLANDCSPTFESVIRAVIYDMTRELAGLVYALTEKEVGVGVRGLNG